MGESEFWMLVRQAALLFVDAIERWQKISPRTSELRRKWKQERLEERNALDGRQPARRGQELDG